MILPKKQNTNKTFVIVSQDYSGLGFAVRLQDEGSKVFLAYKPKDTEDSENFDMCGKGLVTKIKLDEIIKIRKQFSEAYWIFDGNHHSEESDLLSKEGYKVFGASSFQDRLEHDRSFGISIVKKAGFQLPEDQEFNDVQSGIQFLEQNEDKAYVCKPNEPDDMAWVTTVADSEKDSSANEEMRLFLESVGEGKGSYILQEKKNGIEVNVECFMHEGVPYFAHINFENKRKDNGELNRFIGCSQDIELVVSLNTPIIQKTVMKLSKLPEFKDYTGFLDMNVIVADNNFWFLEFCARFGYSAHPNLFFTLTVDPLSDIFADMIDGNTEDFYKHFRHGFGSSITMMIDNPVKGLPVVIPEDMEHYFYHFDTYKENDILKIGGYANEVGIVFAHDYDIKSSADEVIKNFFKIRYPNRSGRTDLNQNDYPNNPWERYLATVSMDLLRNNYWD